MTALVCFWPFCFWTGLLFFLALWSFQYLFFVDVECCHIISWMYILRHLMELGTSIYISYKLPGKHRKTPFFLGNWIAGFSGF